MCVTVWCLQDGNISSSGDEVEDDSAEDEDEVEAGDDYLIAKVGLVHRLQHCLRCSMSAPGPACTCGQLRA